MKALRLAAFALALAACGPAVTSTARDVRVTPPETDDTWFAVQTPEQIIPAKSEKMFCTDLTYDGESTPFRDVETYQGKFGHHIILMSTTAPKPNGTTYDCSDIKSMKDMRPFGIPLDLPPGYGYYMPKGTALVVQMHYVNTSKEDLLVQDFIRLKKVAEADVQKWAAPMSANSDEFTLPPLSNNIRNTFDCTFAEDTDLLLIGGHMHENGSYFKTEIGPDVDHLTKQYEVEQWVPDNRDNPPVTMFTNNPIHVTKGTVIRTTCAWNNQTDHELKFPEEMCATFGVMGGTKTPWICNIGTPL
jgi:hypothetical protein